MLIPFPLALLCNHISQQSRTRCSVPPALPVWQPQHIFLGAGCLQELQISLTSRTHICKCLPAASSICRDSQCLKHKFSPPWPERTHFLKRNYVQGVTTLLEQQLGQPIRLSFIFWHIAEMEESQNHKSWKKTSSIPTFDWIPLVD